MIERVQASKTLDRVVIATTLKAEDDPVVELCRALQVLWYRGSEEDVLDRIYQAAVEYRLGHIVRLTADCPLIDPEIIDFVVRRYLELQPSIDYVFNAMTPTFPNGMEVEVMSLDCLARAHQKADKNYQREHVNPYIREHLDQFKCENVFHTEDLSLHRWTVDYEEDFQLIRHIIEDLSPVKPLFSMKDILRFLEKRPELVDLNRKHPRNEGFARSLEKEEIPSEEKERIAQTILKRSL